MLGFSPAHFKSLCKSEGRDAVYDAKIGSLCLSSHRTCHIFHAYFKDFSCRSLVYVVSGDKVAYHIAVLAQMGHDAQFYLAVIGGEKDIAFVWNEGFSHFFAIFISYRDVLEIGAARRKSSRGCDGLVIACVDMSCGFVDKVWQTVNVCAEQLLIASVVEYLLYYWMLCLKCLKRGFVCDVLAFLCFFCLIVYFEFVKEEFTDLFGRTDIDIFSCYAAYVFFYAYHLFCEDARCLSQ